MDAFEDDSAADGRRVAIIYNPNAGNRRRNRIMAVVGRLTELGCDVKLLQTSGPGDAARLAHKSAGMDVVVAAGGDGTVNEVINGLMKLASPPDLAIIPLGTANVLAYEIQLNPRDIHQIAATIAFGQAKIVQLGAANGRFFVLMAGIGVDANVVAAINADPSLKRKIGKLAYVVETFRQMLSHKPSQLAVTIDGQQHQAGMVVACNGKHYGGPFVAAPQADLAKRELEVCVLPDKGIPGVLRSALALATGQFANQPDVQIISGQIIRVDGPSAAPVQADGETVAYLPVEINCAAGSLGLLMP